MSVLRRIPVFAPAFFVLVLCALAVGFVLAPAETVDAQPEVTLFCTYYTDATYTTPSGGFCAITCTGVSCSGTITAYRQCNEGRRCYTPQPPCSDAPWCDPYWENCCWE